MKKILLALGLLYSVVNAGGCVLTQSNDMNVTWKAYKTLGKIGVGGKFTAIEYKPTSLEGKNFKELLVGSSVVIEMDKIDTGNPARDKTLVEFFFDKMGEKKINATIKDIKADPYTQDKPRTGVVTASITMNKKTQLIPMKYHYENDIFTATGTIDLADFEALTALASINKSCFELHKGKTWADVTIGFQTTIKASLCDVPNIKK